MLVHITAAAPIMHIDIAIILTSRVHGALPTLLTAAAASLLIALTLLLLLLFLPATATLLPLRLSAFSDLFDPRLSHIRRDRTRNRAPHGTHEPSARFAPDKRATRAPDQRGTETPVLAVTFAGVAAAAAALAVADVPGVLTVMVFLGGAGALLGDAGGEVVCWREVSVLRGLGELAARWRVDSGVTYLFGGERAAEGLGGVAALLLGWVLRRRSVEAMWRRAETAVGRGAEVLRRALAVALAGRSVPLRALRRVLRRGSIPAMAPRRMLRWGSVPVIALRRV